MAVGSSREEEVGRNVFKPIRSRSLRSDGHIERRMCRSRVIAAIARARPPSGVGSRQDRRYRQPVIFAGDAGKKPGADQRRLSASRGPHDRENVPCGPFRRRPKPFGDLGDLAASTEEHTVLTSSNARNPGYGDLSSGQPRPPPPSITLSRDRKRSRASDGSRDRRRMLQQRVDRVTRTEAHRQQLGAQRAGGADLRRAPHRLEIRRRDNTDHRVGLPKPRSTSSRSHSSPAGTPSSCPGRETPGARLRTATVYLLGPADIGAGVTDEHVRHDCPLRPKTAAALEPYSGHMLVD